MNKENATALSNSVIENIETGDKIEDLETKVSVKDFTMDNYNLSISFEVELSEKAKDLISADEIVDINFPDLIVSDENNNVLYCMNQNTLDDFCKEKNVNYTPNSANEIIFINDEEITLSGDWKYSLEVPEQIYNREEISYKQKSTGNESYKLIKANITETGTEIKISTKLENVEYPDSSELSSEKQKFFNILLKSGENEEICTDEILNYLGALREYSPEIQEIRNKQKVFREKYYNIDWYITNSMGEKFKPIDTNRISNDCKYNSQTGELELSGHFDLTKYDLTDEIVLHIKHNGNDFEIMLEN